MLGTVAATASYAATVHRAGRVLVRIKRKKQEIQVDDKCSQIQIHLHV